MRTPVTLVAIDGPAGAGKSTVARRVAQRLGLPMLDTGAMYRAVTWAVLDRGIDPGDTAEVVRVAAAVSVVLHADGRVEVDGVDVTEPIRSPGVSAAVSAVAAVPEVRELMVPRQRAWAESHGGGVAEGRDIGSVVFPDASVKVFLTASNDERARRRAAELGAGHDPAAVAADLLRRDEADSTREHSPLTVAEGAVVLDTTRLSVDDVVERIVEMVR